MTSCKQNYHVRDQKILVASYSSVVKNPAEGFNQPQISPFSIYFLPSYILRQEELSSSSSSEGQEFLFVFQSHKVL